MAADLPISHVISTQSQAHAKPQIPSSDFAEEPPVLKNHQMNLKYSQVEIVPGSVVGDFLLVAGPFWWCF